MFLSVSGESLTLSANKKFAWLLVLMVCSTASHADASSVGIADVETAGREAAGVEIVDTPEANVTPDDQLVQREQQNTAKRSQLGSRSTVFGFSRWQQRQPLHKTPVREMMAPPPPPPPGPYRSTALKSYSEKAPMFGSDRSKAAPAKHYWKQRAPSAPDSQFDFATLPMAMFSPDIPWPKNLRPDNLRPGSRAVDDWRSKSAYQHRSSQAAQKPFAPVYMPPAMSKHQSDNRQLNHFPGNFLGNVPESAQNWRSGYAPDSRWMPTMSWSPRTQQAQGQPQTRHQAPHVNSNQYRSNVPLVNRQALSHTRMPHYVQPGMNKQTGVTPTVPSTSQQRRIQQ